MKILNQEMKKEEYGTVLRISTNAIVFGKKFKIVQSVWWGDLRWAKKTDEDFFNKWGGIDGLIRSFQG